MALESRQKLTANKVFLTVYKVVLGFYGLLLVANLAFVGTSLAGFGDLHVIEQQNEMSNNSTAVSTVSEQLCFIYRSAGYLVAILTALFIVWGGISYTLSMGNEKGDFSVSNAKTMIISALTGMFLYMMGFVLLGVCDAKGRGIIPNLFSVNPVSVTAVQT